MKYCKKCGKELNKNQRHNQYCSTNCANLAKKEQHIEDWKSGKNNGTYINGQLSRTIREYLLESRQYKCELCGWNKVNPVTNMSPLEIHHKDGNYINNTEENLQVLCPNCHSLTPNYKALNKNGRVERTNNRKNLCIVCGKPISNGALRCKQCEDVRRITVKPITREELKQLIRINSFVSIGKQFNVTDNTIRKWCKRYNLPSRVKDIKQYSDEEWELI